MIGSLQPLGNDSHEFQDIFCQKLLFFSWQFSFASVKIWSLIIQYGTHLIINWLNFHTSQPLKNSYNHYQNCALHYSIKQKSTKHFRDRFYREIGRAEQLLVKLRMLEWQSKNWKNSDKIIIVGKYVIGFSKYAGEQQFVAQLEIKQQQNSFLSKINAFILRTSFHTWK